MSSAKWQRHSTFLSVRWRTWIGRRRFLADAGVGLLASGNGSSGGASTGRPVVAPHGKKADLLPATWRRPVSYQAARGQLNGAVRDGC